MNHEDTKGTKREKSGQISARSELIEQAAKNFTNRLFFVPFAIFSRPTLQNLFAMKKRRSKKILKASYRLIYSLLCRAFVVDLLI